MASIRQKQIQMEQTERRTTELNSKRANWHRVCGEIFQLKDMLSSANEGDKLGIQAQIDTLETELKKYN